MKKLFLLLALASGCAHAQTFKPLSQSTVFQALQSRVTTLENKFTSNSGATFAGPVYFAGSGNFNLDISGGVNPRLAFDAGDVLAFNQTTNQYSFNIANSAVMSLNSSAMSLPVGSTFYAPTVVAANGSNGTVSLVSGNSTTTGGVEFRISGTRYAYIGRALSGPLGFVSDDGTGFSFVNGAVYFAGDGNFSLNIPADTFPRLTVGPTSYISYDRTNSNFIFVSSSSVVFSTSPYKVHFNLSALPIYADNAAATTGGLVAGDVYRTSTGQLMVRY